MDFMNWNEFTEFFKIRKILNIDRLVVHKGKKFYFMNQDHSLVNLSKNTTKKAKVVDENFSFIVNAFANSPENFDFLFEHIIWPVTKSGDSLKSLKVSFKPEIRFLSDKDKVEIYNGKNGKFVFIKDISKKKGALGLLVSFVDVGSTPQRITDEKGEERIVHSYEGAVRFYQRYLEENPEYTGSLIIKFDHSKTAIMQAIRNIVRDKFEDTKPYQKSIVWLKP